MSHSLLAGETKEVSNFNYQGSMLKEIAAYAVESIGSEPERGHTEKMTIEKYN
jgi:hypothetical protein